MRFPELPADLSALSDEDLTALHSEFVAAFQEATASEEGARKYTAEEVDELSAATDAIESLRTEQTTRSEQADARAATIAELSSRVNASTGEETEGEAGAAEEESADEQTEGGDEGADEGDQESEGDGAPAETDASITELPVTEAAAEQPAAVAASASKPKAVTAGATVAQLKRNAPVRTRPRQQDPTGNAVTITAAADVPGFTPGAQLHNLRQVAEAMCERFGTIGKGNSDSVPVARFNANIPEERHLTRHMSPSGIQARLDSFDRTPQGIVAAGGLCAPVNNYYEQFVIADAARPVKDALANFQADRGGIRYNPPPKLSSLTSGVGTVTASQDASNTTKTAFAVTCQSAVEVDVTSIYTSLLFGNFGARAFPEFVEAWINIGLAAAARKAETVLLDGISAACTTVTEAGLVGAGREVFARLGQVAAGYRSRNRMKAGAPLRLLAPAWTLDLIQADLARTFTDETGLISLEEADIIKLFGVRGLNVSWYLDSKTGGGQIWGNAQGGQTYTDGVFNSDTSLVSATAAFTSADVGKTVTGAGIPANTTISTVTNATTVVLSASTTATGTGKTFTVVRTTAAQFPSTVDAFLFPEGSFLHLDAGTLDLGLVRDSSLNSTNQFQMFSETFENVALVGPEAIEIVLSVSPDGTYGAAKSITNPINS